MKLNFGILVLAAAFSASVSASTLNLDSVDGTQDSAGNFVGPYNGRLDGLTYNIFCDDFSHHIGVPDQETVNVSTIADLHLTRFGSVTGATSLYEQVFYLSTYLVGASAGQRADVQDAMWSFFSNSAPNQAKAGVQAWLLQAQNNSSGKDYSSFRILTEANNSGNQNAQFNGKQELFISTTVQPAGLTGTPEPATWAMLLTGMSGLAFARFRRKGIAK